MERERANLYAVENGLKIYSIQGIWPNLQARISNMHNRERLTPIFSFTRKVGVSVYVTHVGPGKFEDWQRLKTIVAKKMEDDLNELLAKEMRR